MCMNKELRAYRMADKVMRYATTPLEYQNILDRTRRFVNDTPFFWGWFCHFGDNDAAVMMADELSKKIFSNFIYSHQLKG